MSFLCGVVLLQCGHGDGAQLLQAHAPIQSRQRLGGHGGNGVPKRVFDAVAKTGRAVEVGMGVKVTVPLALSTTLQSVLWVMLAMRSGRPSASSLRPYSCSKVQVMGVSSATCRPDGNANGWTLGTRVGKSGWGHGDGAVAVVKAAKVNRAALFCKTPLWFFCVAWRVPRQALLFFIILIAVSATPARARGQFVSKN